MTGKGRGFGDRSVLLCDCFRAGVVLICRSVGGFVIKRLEDYLEETGCWAF